MTSDSANLTQDHRDSVLGRSPGASARDGSTTWAHRGLIVAIVVVGAFLRFAALDQYPLPLHQDELSDIYDGYSLATTGADRAGEAWPIIIRGMGPGDYHPGLYVYLAALSTGIGGFSVWSGRLPAAIAGVLTVILVFAVARRLLGPRGAVLALLLVVFSPIHVLYSRQAHTGGCLPPLFAVLIVYLLLKTLDALGSARRQVAQASSLPAWSKPLVRREKAPVWIAAAGLAIGLSTSAYGALRLSGLLFAVFGATLLVSQVGVLRGKWRQTGGVLVLFAGCVGIGAAPQLYAMLSRPEHFFTRAVNVVPPLTNGLHWWFRKVIFNAGLNLDPRHLFFSFGEDSILSAARLSLASLPFLYFGMLVALVRTAWRRHLPTLLLLGATFICLMPAAVGRLNPHPMRASGVWALYPILAALGAVTFGTILSRGWAKLQGGAGTSSVRAAWAATAAVAVLIAAAGTFNVVRYLRQPDWHGDRAQNDLVAIGQWARDHGDQYDRIFVDAPGLFPYLYVTVFSGMSPAEFQNTPRDGTVTAFGWEKFSRFGRFCFATTDTAWEAWRASDQTESWVVLSPDAQPLEFHAQRHAEASLRQNTENRGTKQ